MRIEARGRSIQERAYLIENIKKLRPFIIKVKGQSLYYLGRVKPLRCGLLYISCDQK
jgi:hypothetical protein